MFTNLVSKSNISNVKDQRVVGIYSRVSTREQSELGYSVRDQVVKIEKYLDYVKEGEMDIEKYIDEGQSARSLKRRSMNRLIEDIKNRKVKAVVIHNLDRITRKMKDFITLIELFEKYNVELISLREKLETNSAMGRFLVGIIILIAEWEADTISERTIRGLDRSAAEGNYSISRANPPLGYRIVNKKLMVKKRDAQIAKYIFDKIASDEYTAHSIVAHLKNKYPQLVWTEKNVRKLIRSKIYIGIFENKRISIPNHSPAIIDVEVFKLANKAIDDRSRKPKYNYIFKKKIICDDCNEFMRAEPGTSSTNRTIYMYYRCPKCHARVSENNIQRMLVDKLNNYAWSFNQGLWSNLITLSKRELMEKMKLRVLYSKMKRTADITIE